MENLPPYDSFRAVSHGTVSPAPTMLVSTPLSPVNMSSVIGGSGVRVPLSPQELADFESKTCARLRSWGTYTRIHISATGSSEDTPTRSEPFRPVELYQSAISQLNVLLPALSSTCLPATTTLRTITLRVVLPSPDAAWMNECIRTGPVQGREVLGRGLKNWIAYFASKKGEKALYEAADSIVGRLAIEGFLVLEEWWDLKRGLLMLTVRC
ncbi:hypothetical protein CTheo_5255 [Ceratobasidium theobromae]|uniref:Uncharacterized protein n=1 Tax=Ceratobasidium theobromae TaxID=1582974 RepID=A0A5N5QIL0_9AGAM|nr:hypothetical protein CTheo_5255 [Ceratobasidium theobromae]